MPLEKVKSVLFMFCWLGLGAEKGEAGIVDALTADKTLTRIKQENIMSKNMLEAGCA